MNKKQLGFVVATAVASLVLTGNAMAEQTAAPQAAKVKCSGINECKGKGACSGATNGCAGKNECKGKGWVETTPADCTTKGGKVEK